jgi:hypothetical protein
MATLGGVTVPEPKADPTGNAIGARDAATVMEMADGSIRQHYRGSRQTFKIVWAGISTADKNTLYLRYKDRAVQAWQAADMAGSVNVLVTPGSWAAGSRTMASGYVWDVSFSVEEQAAST